MLFRIEIWTIGRLIADYAKGNLDLNPPYQRRFIWSLDDQRTLIDSIQKNYPIPNIFLKQNTATSFEVVDGQQRLRTIIGFRNSTFTDFDNKVYDSDKYPDFDNYEIATIIIEEIGPNDISIHDYYGLVNNSGEHLNRPEIKKAEYFETDFLRLINACNDYPDFKELALFTDSVQKRMNDMDFVSELIILLRDGITEKKDQVDKTYKSDISESEYNELYPRFTGIIDQLVILNRLYPIKKTRYKQRNDFYTLFGFLKDYQLDPSHLEYIYRILVLIGSNIAPSNDDCLPFQNYARNCVTHSNSKNARLERKSLLDELFLNTEDDPNPTQLAILEYYDMAQTPLIEHNSYYSISYQELKDQKPAVSFND